MTGEELAQLGPSVSCAQLENVDVFARVSAEQKLLIVRILQSGDHVVAMTGDGINDAPALRQADIGIAMGFGGTEVAKEAADMALTDDNFATIEAAIEEGRSIFDNLTKFLTWTLPTNMGEGLVVLAAIASGVALPILPVQILWINMTTAVLLGLMLAFEPAEMDIMDRPPRRPNRPILTAVLLRRIAMVGVIMLVGTFVLFEWSLSQGSDLDQARTVTVNAFVAMEIGYLFNCRVLKRPVMAVGLFSNRLLIMGVLSMVVLQIAYTYLPAMNYVFQSSPLTWQQWVVILALGLAVYFIVEIEKWITSLSNRPSRMSV
jgi:magnesium-transporting ATPase (P-type)